MQRNRFFTLAFLAVMCALATNAHGADQTARVSEEIFHIAPRIVQLTGVEGTDYSMAVAAYVRKKDRAIKIGIRRVGPNNECPADPEAFANNDDSSLVVTEARFEGDIKEVVIPEKMISDTKCDGSAIRMT